MIKFDGSALAAAIKVKTDAIAASIDEDGLRKIGFTGAAIFREQAKANAASHKKTGVLYNNIIVKRLEEESDGGNKQTYIVTVRSGKYGADGDAYYWRWVENGHKFVPRNKKVSKKTGKTIGWAAHRKSADKAAEARRLEYGTAGAPAYPFMRPAFDAKHDEAVEAMKKLLREQVKQAAGGN